MRTATTKKIVHKSDDRSIPAQMEYLYRLSGNLVCPSELHTAQKLPQKTTWLVIPLWHTLASTYPEALLRVLAELQVARGDGFHNFLEGGFGSTHLYQATKIETSLDLIARKQNAKNTIVFPVKSDMKSAGKIPNTAHLKLDQKEFMLDVYTAGILLLTYPERLMKEEQLGIDCTGTKYGNSEKVLCFWYADNKLWFGTRHADRADNKFGSSTGFVL